MQLYCILYACLCKNLEICGNMQTKILFLNSLCCDWNSKLIRQLFDAHTKNMQMHFHHHYYHLLVFMRALFVSVEFLAVHVISIIVINVDYCFVPTTSHAFSRKTIDFLDSERSEWFIVCCFYIYIYICFLQWPVFQSRGCSLTLHIHFIICLTLTGMHLGTISYVKLI